MILLGGRILWKAAGLLATISVMPVTGVTTLSGTPPALTITPSQPAPGYGDFGGPGNPYGPGRSGAADPHLAGPFSDEQPLSATTAAQVSSGNLADYSQSGLNGGNSGFPAASLTVNQTLPSGQS